MRHDERLPNFDLRIEVHTTGREYILFGYSARGRDYVRSQMTLGRYTKRPSALVLPWYVGVLVQAHAQHMGLVVEFIPPDPPPRLFVLY